MRDRENAGMPGESLSGPAGSLGPKLAAGRSEEDLMLNGTLCFRERCLQATSWSSAVAFKHLVQTS